jgi:hypothetical protein
MRLESILQAAIRYGELVVTLPPPARHNDIIAAWYKQTRRISTSADVQGFLTSRGNFVSREIALQIAKDCGQPLIDHPSRHDTKLFSEDLW